MKSIDVVFMLAILMLGPEVPTAYKDRGQKSHHGRGYNTVGSRHHRPPTNITAVNGVGVDLMCRVRVHECGNFFSIVWYRETDSQERVYVYRHHSGVSKAEGVWSGRASHVYDTTRFLMVVSLTPLILEDQGKYRCEITYEDQAGRWFKDSCLAAQVTNLIVYGQPDYVKVSLENETEVENGATIGPYVEGQLLVLRCDSSGGRPVPDVSWWNNTQKILNSWDWRVEHENGTGSAKSEINVVLTRFDIGREISCRVNSSATKDTLISRLHLDVSVSPFSLVMDPDNNHIEEGGKISVTCTTTQAKPPAFIYWNSDPKFEQLEEEEKVIQTNKTFTTISKVTFKAHRELTSLSCFATNKVMDDKKMPHFSASSTVNVKYRPEILVHGLSVVYVVLGDNIGLHCNYKANPAVTAKVTWYRNGKVLKHKNIDVRNITQDGAEISINNAVRSSSGLYSCLVSNEVGTSQIVDIASVYVEDVPEVVLTVDPVTPVSEPKKQNVTLICDPLPPDETLLQVKWFLDGELLKKLPECGFKNDSTYGNDITFTAAVDALCNMDPTKIILENVGRNFHGNYSCQGKNRAGWGKMSNCKYLSVYYPPVSVEKDQFQNLYVKKGEGLVVPCLMKDLGFPKAKSAVWLKDGIRMKNESGLEFYISNAGVESDRNYTCIPFNSVGKGLGSSVSVLVTTKPAFVKMLTSNSGAPIDRKKVVLTCVVECSPLCSISWTKNNTTISNSTYYQIFERVKLRDYTTNTLSHVESELVFNITSWTGGLVPERDRAQYTCTSSDNKEGPGVNSSTLFRVHYSPRNIRISPHIQTVKEKLRPRDFLCTAEAFPPAKFFWQFENGTRTRKGAKLEFKSAIRRTDGGTYTCTAFNDMGNVKAETNLNVVFKPDCFIEKELRDRVLYLKCEVEAFPPNVTYYWYHNEDLISSAVFSSATQFEVTDGMQGEFSCQARNLAGLGTRCDVKINGPVAALVAETDFSFLMFGGGLVIFMFIVITMTIIICRHINIHLQIKFKKCVNSKTFIFSFIFVV